MVELSKGWDEQGSDDGEHARSCNENEDAVGYRKPPKSTRFVKGQSGNPAGRPRKQPRSEAPYAAILERLVSIREGGRERKVTAIEAFLLQLAKKGIEGDGVAARTALTLIERAKAARGPQTITRFVLLGFGNVSYALEHLSMARTEDPFGDASRVELEPWIVQAALARLPQPLTVEQQREILAATRAPQKVRWPEWWSEHPSSTLCSKGRQKSNDLAPERTGIPSQSERY